MTAIYSLMGGDFFCEKRRGESLNYLAAVACVIALTLINIYGTESESINTILSGAIMACIWGGTQRRRQAEQDETETKKPAIKRGRAVDK